MCCVDERCGCPYDEDVPCACATCCLVHHVSYQEVPPGMGCCVRINDAVRNSKSGVYTKGRKFGYNNSGAGVGPGVIARSAVAPAPRSQPTDPTPASGTSGASAVNKSAKGFISQKGTPFQPAPASPGASTGSVRVVPLVSRPVGEAQQVPVQPYVPQPAAVADEMEVESLE